MKVIPITRGDLQECAALFVEVFNGEPWNESWSIEPVLARFNECFNTPGFSGLIGRDGDVICFALGYAETWDSSKHYFLKEMCVARDRQRSGIGSELITEIEKDLIQKGIQKIYLVTSRDGSAESFYRKNSFYVGPKMIMMGKYLTVDDSDGTTNRRRQSREAGAFEEANLHGVRLAPVSANVICIFESMNDFLFLFSLSLRSSHGQ